MLLHSVIYKKLYINLSGYTEIKLYRTCRQVYITNKARSNWWVKMNHNIQVACATTTTTATTTLDREHNDPKGVYLIDLPCAPLTKTYNTSRQLKTLVLDRIKPVNKYNNTPHAPAHLLISSSQANLTVQSPTHNNMPRREGSHWIGFAAFQLRCEGQQWAILADEKDTHPFVIDDASDPKLPDWLKTTRWGDWGYSTWCQNIEAALKEASNSKSRGWRRINGMDYNQLQNAWWIVLELILCSDHVCDLINRAKITCNIELKGVPTWRIAEDIYIPNLRAKGGLVQKHVVYGWGTAVFQDFDKFTLGLTIFTGTCISCKKEGPLCAQQCAQCWNNSIPPPPPAEVPAIEAAATSSHNKIQKR